MCLENLLMHICEAEQDNPEHEDTVCINYGTLSDLITEFAEQNQKHTFDKGVVWACARVVELHDRGVVANDVLKEANISQDELKILSEYDLEFLRREDSAIPEGID